MNKWIGIVCILPEQRNFFVCKQIRRVDLATRKRSYIELTIRHNNKSHRTYAIDSINFLIDIDVS